MIFRWSRIDTTLAPGIHEPKHDGDVGWDLVAMKTVIITPGAVEEIPINARIELPKGHWGEIRARSSIAKRGLQVDAGTIDNGYRGPLFVITRSMIKSVPGKKMAIRIEQGERVGQLVFHKIFPMTMEEVESIELETTRGENGFGSTGL